MATERWQRIETLYHEARGRTAAERDAFLSDACAGDELLQREVQSLLDQPSMPGFLSEPALAVAASMATARAGTPAIGTRIGVYQLQSLLGRGGMGEVYRAHDTKLGRDVALKLLPPGFTADADRLARFTREARVLASLNHPNIGTIHGFEEAGDVRALVLELVEGDTLADRIARGPLPVSEALAIARQIADALEAAHDKGIVHRDLKPANVKITPDGFVKVLDFGLAKSDPGGSAGPELANSPTLTVGATVAGLILGTAAYMSPEQARGRAVDKRTDVWAFGCVLYELLTGRAAFSGDTVSDTIAAILHRETDWNALPAALPSTITTLLRRCLEKDVKKRKRDIGDARAELDDMIARPPSAVPAVSAAAVEPRAGSQSWMPWVATAAALAVAIVAWWPRAQPWRNPLADAKFTKFTTFIGAETSATISPDGRWVAFLADRDGGPFHVWLRSIAGGDFKNLTPASADLQSQSHLGGGGNFRLGFTEDGTQIWLSGGANSPVQLVPLVGGTLRPFLGNGTNNLAYSPDGRRLLYNTSLDGDPMFVADTSGANPTQVFGSAVGLHNHGPRWSRDGWIYFIHTIGEINDMNVWRVRPDGGEPETLATGKLGIASLAPIDDRTLLYVGLGEDGSGPWLWALDLDTKTSHRISSGIEQYTSISASADGRTLVASEANPRTSLWTVPILDRIADLDDVQAFGPPGLQALSPSQRGTALFYQSASGTGDGLWRLKDEQTLEIWSASQGAVLEPSSVSPDGLRVAFTVWKDRRRTLVVRDVDGGAPRTLATSIEVRGTVDWSPDGKWLVVGGIDGAAQAGVFKIPVDGGSPVKIVSELGINPTWSSSGDLIMYAGKNTAGRRPLLAARLNGEAVDLPEVLMTPRTRLRFLRDGSGVVFLGHDGRATDFWLFDLGTMKPRRLTRISTDSLRGAIQSFDITPDGKMILFDRLAENSDIVLIERPPR